MDEVDESIKTVELVLLIVEFPVANRLPQIEIDVAAVVLMLSFRHALLAHESMAAPLTHADARHSIHMLLALDFIHQLYSSPPVNTEHKIISRGGFTHRLCLAWLPPLAFPSLHSFASLLCDPWRAHA